MVLIRALAVIVLLLVAAAVVAPEAGAHKNEQHEQVGKEKATAPAGMTPGAMQERMEEHAEAMEQAQPKIFIGRLTGWLGRMHPFAVHFPIALFPVALVALVLARKRGETVELIRALIVVAGAGAVVAAALGWLNGGLTVNDTDTVLMLHRWLGTFLGLIGGGVGWWAWRRRASVNSGLMVTSLGLIVALLLAQGFLGAAVTHGMEHMMF